MPQAVGCAYGLKRLGPKDACVLCYYGEGAASEGDAMVGFNMSATLQCPVLWFCRNNGYAISTPTKDQYCGDGISARGHGYGMYVIRFDANDVFATYTATKEARKLCIEEQRPIILEGMTYRGSHHSTSDEDSRYKPDGEKEEWSKKYCPISRMRNYLTYVGLWDNKKQADLLDKVDTKVDEVRERAEQCLKPHWKHLYTDVYDKLPSRLERQMKEMEEHLNCFGEEEFYKIHEFSHNFERQVNKDL